MKNQSLSIFRLFFSILALSAMILPTNLMLQVRAEKNSVSVEQIIEQPTVNRVAFEENRGQIDPRVRYFSRTGGFFLTADEAVYVLPLSEEGETGRKGEGEKDQIADSNSPLLPVSPSPLLAFALRMKIVGANPESTFSAENLAEGRTNYLKGNDAANWQIDVPSFGTVRYENVYDGIGMVWHGLESGATRYDFVVQPNADANQIALEFDGADNLELDAEGNLLIQTAAGTIKQNKPFSFQEIDGVKQEVESRFVIEQSKIENQKSKIRFAIGEYDRSKPLTIDPTVNLANLAFSTFLGGVSNDQGLDIAVDGAANVYVTGFTQSLFFPTTSGTFDTTYNANDDIFVTKMNGSGGALIYSTFIGGSGSEQGRGIVLDSAGNAYVTGETTTSAFPTTVGAFDTSFNGSADVYSLKLNPTGTALVYSTFLGSGGFDESFNIARDSSNNVYIIGRTNDGVPSYPTTVGAFDTTYNGATDAFVSKLDANGATLLYSTYLGGTANEFGQGIAVDSSGNAYVTGFTASADFSTTAGAFDTTFNGGSNDIFVSKINPAGSALTYSTFIGGTDSDSASEIAVDIGGNATVVGSVVNGGGFPTTVGAFDTTHNGAVDAIVTSLNSSGSALNFSTYIGGSGSENGNGIALDNFGNIFITGLTIDAVTDHPTTAGAFDTTHNGGHDVFMSKFNSNGTSLLYSTLLGGAGDDDGFGITVDANGNAYCTGLANNAATDLPTTVNAFQTDNGGLTDVFVSKFGDFSITGKVIDATTGAPLSNVMVAMSGQVSANMLTGADGTFGFTDTVSFGVFAVSATRSGYSMNPAVFNIANLNANRELIFVGAVGSPTGGSGGTLRFENLSYNKAENGSTVTVTVKRIGTITEPNPVTVDFTTVSGTAVEGQDFAATSGVLTFNVLETTKTITVPLLNDATLEPREDFSISLNNPTNNAEIENGRGSTNVQILDEDLSNGALLISEFRERGRLGANDEYVKLFNPNNFDVTIQTPDNSNGLTLGRETNGSLASIATIPNLVTIPARGHYLLTNNNPNGGFSLIDYPTGNGSTTATGDQTFSADIPDNSNLVLLKTANANNFNQANLLDAVGFGASVWTNEGRPLAAIAPENFEGSYVRKLTPDGLQDTGDNQNDFLLTDNHAAIFSANIGKIYAVLGAPAPETSDSLRLMTRAQIGFTEFGSEIFNPTPIPNGAQGTLTMYRQITNNTNQPLTRLRLRVIDFPTAGSPSQRRYSSRPDFRLLSSLDEIGNIKGVTLAAERLSPNGGGINSTLTVDSITANTPLLPNQTVVVAIKFGVMRYGRHPFTIAVEAMQ